MGTRDVGQGMHENASNVQDTFAVPVHTLKYPLPGMFTVRMFLEFESHHGVGIKKTTLSVACMESNASVIGVFCFMAKISSGIVKRGVISQGLHLLSFVTLLVSMFELSTVIHLMPSSTMLDYVRP